METTTADMDLIGLAEDYVLCKQYLDSHGVCVIPSKQAIAVQRFLAEHSRKIASWDGDVRNQKLKIFFQPRFTDAEVDQLIERL